MAVTVIAKMRAKNGLADRVEGVLKSLIGPTRGEGGCVEYRLHQSSEDAAVFMFYETWESQADLDEHLRKPYLQDLISKADELFDGEMEVSTWREFD